MKVDEMQRKLSQKSAKEPAHLFENLYGLLCNKDGLRAAYESVNANKGRKTAGVDHITMKYFNTDVDGNIDLLSKALKAKTFEPRPVKRVYIPKADGKKRPLGMPMGHAYCTPSNALWVSKQRWARDPGPPSRRAMPYAGEWRGVRCRTSLRKTARRSGVRVIQRGWCGAAWIYSHWPAIHQSAIVLTSTCRRAAAARAAYRPSSRGWSRGGGRSRGRA